MFQFAWQAGSDAAIPVIYDAYEQMVAGYNAVEEALRLYRMGVESYDYYLAKVREFKKNHPDAPSPPTDIPPEAPPHDPTLLPELPETSGLDFLPDEAIPSGDPEFQDVSPTGDGVDPWGGDPPGQDGGVYPIDTNGENFYPENSFVPERSGAARRGGGGSRKVQYRVRYSYY